MGSSAGYCENAGALGDHRCPRKFRWQTDIDPSTVCGLSEELREVEEPRGGSSRFAQNGEQIEQRGHSGQRALNEVGSLRHVGG